jgi:predicted  nucleic acid-binding Zn-ribbon protein
MNLIKTLTAVLLVVTSVSLSGCADNSPDGLVKQQISQMNRLADAIESKKSAETIESIKSDMKAVTDKLDALDLSPKEKADLISANQEEIRKASERMMKNAMEMMKHEQGNAANKLKDLMPSN